MTSQHALQLCLYMAPRLYRSITYRSLLLFSRGPHDVVGATVVQFLVQLRL